MDQDYVLWEQCPTQLSSVLIADVVGVIRLRPYLFLCFLPGKNKIKKYSPSSWLEDIFHGQLVNYVIKVLLG